MSIIVGNQAPKPRSRHGRVFLKRHLKPGEELVAAEQAYIGELMGRGDRRQHNGEILVTSERVAFYRKRLLGGEILRTIPIRNVTAVDRLSNLLWAWIEVHTSNEKIRVGFPQRGDDRINDAIERMREMKRAT